MEKILVFLCCAVVAVIAQNEITLDDSSDRLLQLGQKDVKISFTINKSVIVMYSAKMLLKSISDSGNVRVLFEQMNRRDAEPSFYDIDVNFGEDQVNYVLTIKEVREEDEGRFLVQYFAVGVDENTSPPTAEASFEMNIERPMESLSLKFGNYGTISKIESNPFEMDAGTVMVTCTARGSNPKVSNLVLYKNDQVISSSLDDMRMETELRRFKTMASAEVKFEASDVPQSIRCEAEQPFSENGETNLVTVSAPVKINTYDPKIECNEPTAYPRMMYPKLICIVDHTDLNVKDFRYKIKKTGEEITAGQKGQNNERVEITSVGDSKTKVVLDLYSAKDWHFAKEQFLLIVENENGFLTQVPITLTRIPGGNKAGFVTASLSAVLMSVLLGALLRLQ